MAQVTAWRETEQTRRLPANVQQCIENCLNTLAVCTESVTYCLEKGGDHANADHVRALMDCAETCRTSVDLMLRGSPLHAQACATCAEACATCAESCEQFAGDAQMEACAADCRASEKSCREMADHA